MKRILFFAISLIATTYGIKAFAEDINLETVYEFNCKGRKDGYTDLMYVTGDKREGVFTSIS